MELSARQQQILRAIVESYIATARPIGSSALASASQLAVSSATVRNEMAVLEGLGLIRQLHTSGGRVPTNAGYQYYVERLMGTSHLAHSDARTIRHQFHQSHTEVQEWLKLAATILANRLHNVGIITAPRQTEVRCRHLELISTQHTLALLIVVLQDSTVLQEMVKLGEPHSQEELSALADRLNTSLRERGSVQIEQQLIALPPLDSAVAQLVVNLLRRKEAEYTQIFHAGLSDMIRQPEFLEPRPGEGGAQAHARLRHMVEFLQHGFAMDQLLAGLPAAYDVQIVIGGGDSSSGLHEYSFVLGRYGDQAVGSGYLGILGPTRMEYPRAVALVRYMRDLMTDLIQAY
jgi:heat-inducible transcriptional repressor